ncbi:MAG: hypothetical protein QM820_25885 [Minicystis sp.]
MKTTSLSFAMVCALVACGGGSASTGGSGGHATSTGGAGGDASTTSTTGSNGSTSTTGTGGSSGGCVPSLPTFADGKSPSVTVHVQAGAPAGGDGSAGKPFATLLAALQAAKPGTEVRVSGALPADTYTTGVKGTDAAPIWITGEPGARIGPLTLQTASHVIVRDLEISGSATGHVLHFFDADHLLFQHIDVHDAGLSVIKGSQASNVYFEDSEFWDGGKQSGYPLFDYVGVNTGHVVRSNFHDNPGIMLMLKGGTSDLLVAWNEIHHQTNGGNALELGESTGPQYFQPLDSAFEGLRIVAFGNLLHDLAGPPVSFEGCKDCAALHNTIWSTTGPQLVRFLPGAAGMSSGATVSLSQGCRFAGNIVVGGQSNGASLNANPQNHGPGNVVDYNVFLKPGSLNWWGDIAQDTTHSTFDKDPMVSGQGMPGNAALVDGKGPPDIGAMPFASVFVRDYAGKCLTLPADIGAISVP